MRYLELNSQGVVVNVVVWDGVSHYEPAGIAQLLPCDQHPGISFGWTKVEGGWIAPPEPEQPQE
jgi:hypothetical protein